MKQYDQTPRDDDGKCRHGGVSIDFDGDGLLFTDFLFSPEDQFYNVVRNENEANYDWDLIGDME